MNDLEFDRRARALHAQALAAQSPRVRAQLHNRLQSVLSSPPARPPVHAHRWRWASAAALVLGLAFAAPWLGMQQPAAPPAVAQATGGNVGAPATLEQDPDFYLWLASSDAVALASE